MRRGALAKRFSKVKYSSKDSVPTAGIVRKFFERIYVHVLYFIYAINFAYLHIVLRVFFLTNFAVLGTGVNGELKKRFSNIHWNSEQTK